MRTRRIRWLLLSGLFCFLLAFWCFGMASGAAEPGVLGPQSTISKGEQRVLMVAVRFPDVEPSFTLEQIKKRAVSGLNQYVKEQSYGLTWINADFRGWINLPDPISQYNVSPYNFKVDRRRVRKLIEDTMTALEDKADFSGYQHILIIPGAFTQPGKGYGMLCYCANPGMLTGVKGRLGYETLRSRGGKEFKGGHLCGGRKRPSRHVCP